MTSVVEVRLAQALRRAAVRATYAPSVHNTQPWRLTLSPHALELHADWSRQLPVLDPTGRQLLISCGCALLNARAALEKSDCAVRVERGPDQQRPDLLARLTVTPDELTDGSLAALDAVIELRQTNRRKFADATVDPYVVQTMVAAAATEGAQLIELTHPEQRLTLARLTQEADRQENADPAYRAELRAWTTDDPGRRDGVPALAVPHVDGHAHDDIPIRDFDTHGTGWLPADTQSGVRQCLLLLGTAQDDAQAWVHAGEALERIWLEAVRHGYTMSLFTQVIEVDWTREALRRQLQTQMYPHVVLRIGRAPRTPSSRRRRLVDVLTEPG